MSSSMNLNFKKSLDRAIVMVGFPTGKPVNFTIYHHKRNSAIQFDLNSNCNPIKNQKVKVSMYRNLENCKFCNTFFKLQTLKNDNCDFQCKFIGTNKGYEKYIFPFCKEKYELQVQDDPAKKSINYLMVLGYKLHDLQDDLVFYFVQRRIYNNVSRLHTVRSAGLQFATDRALDILDKYNEHQNERIEKVQNLPSFMIDNN